MVVVIKKLLLIDIDDTICNSSEAYKVALSHCHKFLNKKYPLIDEKTFSETFKKAREQIHLELNGTASMHERFLYFQRMFEILGLALDPETLDEITEIFWNETYNNLKLYPHVKETLNLVKENNMRVGIVSDLVAHVQIKKLKKLGLSKYVDFIVTSEEAGKEKPHPSIFLLALKKANCLPEETVMVGDSVEKDIQGAKHLGMSSVLFSSGYKKADGADFVISDFSELIKILGLNKRKLISDKIVIFDLMGNVFKEGHIVKNLLFPIALKSGIKVEYEKLKELYVDYSLGKITQAEFRKIVPQDVEKSFLNSIKLDEETLSVVEWLKRKKCVLGILSNIPKEWGDYLVRKFELNKYFMTIVFSGEYGTRKPDEELYLIFMEKAKAKPQNCYLIDDKLINLREARFLLMKTIWRKTEEQEIQFIPDCIIENASDLRKVFTCR